MDYRDYLIDDIRNESRWVQQQLRRLNDDMARNPRDPDRQFGFDDMTDEEVAEYEQWLRSVS